MRKMLGMAGLLALGAATAFGQTSIMTHWELQSVNSTGYTAWAESPTSFPFAIRGVIVNDPEEMLDPTYDPAATAMGYTGGMYQVFFQAVDAGDRGGTALWMVQNYEAMGAWIPAGNDYDADWTNEMRRVMVDANGRKFRKGDLIEVTAHKALFYNGKCNVNENHRIAPSYDFAVVLVKANAGLPQAEALTLADLKNADDSAIFDATRATGGEHWQGMRVRLDGLRLATTNGWGKTNWAARICTATDGAGRTLPLRMPLTDLGAPPATSAWFSAVGILNQENGYTNGYELFVQEIGPVLNVGTNITGSLAVSFSADYEGYVLEASDDGLQTWGDVDVTPNKVIVIEDDSDSPTRAYRLRKVD